MSNRKRKRRPRPPSGLRGGAGSAGPQGSKGVSKPTTSAPRKAAPSAPAQSAPPRGLWGWLRGPSGGAAGSARRTQPRILMAPIGRSLARGLGAAGRSPAILVTAFVGDLILWLAYTSSGVIRVASSAAMGQIQALAPIHNLMDEQFLFLGLRVLSPTAVVAFAVGLIVLRALLTSIWLNLMGASLGGGRGPIPLGESDGGGAARRSGTDPETPGGSGRVTLRAVLPRVLLTWQTLIGVEAGFAVLVFAAPTVIGPILGQPGVILALVAVMYFFVFAPVTAVVEGVGVRAAIRLSSRTARMAGLQHVAFCTAYFFVMIFVLAVPPRAGSPVTPSLLQWLYTLLFTFLHLGVLGALVYRWLGVRGEVLEAEASGPAQPRQRAQAGRRSR